MRFNSWRVRLRPHLRLIGLALLICCLMGYLSGQAAAHQVLLTQSPIATAKDARPALTTSSVSLPPFQSIPPLAVSNNASHGHQGDHGGNGHGGKHHGD